MANLIFNEAALHRLLDDEQGPVGLELKRITENVTALVRANATKILEEMPPSVIDYEISSDDNGLQAVIGMTGQGRWGKYLAAKEERERVIFAPALDIGLHV